MSLAESTFRLAAMDVANESGVAIVTLRSGAEFRGRVDKRLSLDVLHLVTAEGWHTIDYSEVAAISGESS